MTKPLAIILATIMIDAIGIGLIFPIMPSLLRDLTGSGEISLLYGVMLAVYSFMQFVFAPVLGLLSDRFGRRPVLLVSLAAAAVDYLILAFSPSVGLIFAGRAFAGLLAANVTVATAYIADISDEKDRAQRFGYLHAAFGIGFIVGPLLGGILGTWWVRAPFLAAALFNGINFLMALLALPESRHGTRERIDLATLNPLTPLKWAFMLPGLLPLLAIYFAISFVGQTYGTVWVLFGEDRFLWNATMVGLSLACFGLFHAGAQILLPGPITRAVGARMALLIGITAEIAALVILALISDGWIVFVIMPLFALGGVGVPALQSMLSAAAGNDRQGQIQGVLSSLVSLTAILGPLAFSAIYAASRDQWNGLVWAVGVAVYLISLPLFLNRKPAAEPV